MSKGTVKVEKSDKKTGQERPNDREAVARPRGVHPIDQLRREIDALFDDFFEDALDPWPGLPVLSRWERRPGVSAPRLDVSETEDAIEVKADLPGMEEKDIKVTLDEERLIISGERREERDETSRDFHMVERSRGRFERTVPVPRGIDRDEAKAQFRNGVLTLTLPKTAEARKKTRRIEVSSI